jgi:hypothetical protein
MLLDFILLFISPSYLRRSSLIKKKKMSLYITKIIMIINDIIKN